MSAIFGFRSDHNLLNRIPSPLTAAPALQPHRQADAVRFNKTSRALKNNMWWNMKTWGCFQWTLLLAVLGLGGYLIYHFTAGPGAQTTTTFPPSTTVNPTTTTTITNSNGF